jgi:hypothetical protein
MSLKATDSTGTDQFWSRMVHHDATRTAVAGAQLLPPGFLIPWTAMSHNHVVTPKPDRGLN